MTIESVIHQVNVLRDRLEDAQVLTHGQLKIIREHIEICHLVMDRRVEHRRVDVERRKV